MIKKLDGYIIKTFLGPFIFIFSVLFFIFLVQFAWSFLDKFTGKGLGLYEVLKLLYYLGITVIQIVFPLTILLSTIMAFGGFGERYELAAMKSTGISLVRIMYPLFFLVILFSIGLYFFSDRIVPSNQKKARNMLVNIASTRPALNFVAGQFLTSIPGFTLKVNEKTGKDGQFLNKVFIHKSSQPYEDDQTIIAEKGVISPSPNKIYLKLDLYDGYIYQNQIKDLTPEEKNKYPNTSIKFDTLQMLFDIKDVINKALERETVTDYYKFYDFMTLECKIDSVNKDNIKQYKSNTEISYNQMVMVPQELDTMKLNKPINLGITLDQLNDAQKQKLVDASFSETENNKNEIEARSHDVYEKERLTARMIMFQHRMISYSVSCLALFLIGAPLGAIIRKGGVGLPVVVSVFIFLIFHLSSTYTESIAKDNILDAYWATWLPNLILLPLGLFLVYKSNNDSSIFEAGKYFDPIKLWFRKTFQKNKNNEHKRYQ